MCDHVSQKNKIVNFVTFNVHRKNIFFFNVCSCFNAYSTKSQKLLASYSEEGSVPGPVRFIGMTGRLMND